MPGVEQERNGSATSVCAELASVEKVEACSEERVRAVVQHISHSDLTIAPNIRAISASMFISASRLRHLFKDGTGISILRYLKLIRLRRAHDLLSTGQVTVREAMAETGMKDISHFGRDYKAVFGETPRETRIAAVVDDANQS